MTVGRLVLVAAIASVCATRAASASPAPDAFAVAAEFDRIPPLPSAAVEESGTLSLHAQGFELRLTGARLDASERTLRVIVGGQR